MFDMDLCRLRDKLRIFRKKYEEQLRVSEDTLKMNYQKEVQDTAQIFREMYEEHLRVSEDTLMMNYVRKVQTTNHSSKSIYHIVGYRSVRLKCSLQPFNPMPYEAECGETLSFLCLDY